MPILKLKVGTSKEDGQTMARYLGSKHHLCKAEGVALCGSLKCPVLRRSAPPPGQHGARAFKKKSEYAIQLREKQKVKRIYQVLERQFKKYYTVASRAKGATSNTLLRLLETRLDNVIFRLKLAKTRQQARQLVSHGHILVNGKKVTIPSFNVKIGDVISLSAKAANFEFVKKLAQETKEIQLPSWLTKKAIVAKVTAMPKRDDIDADIDERLIIEYYSR